MKTFAKIFQTDKHGQILVRIDVDENAMPSMIVSVVPPDMGVCEYAMSWKDTDLGYAKRDEIFESMSVSEAGEWADIIFLGLGL